MDASFPCHPDVDPAAVPARDGWRACPRCGTELREGGVAPPAYDAEYVRRRSHHEPAVGLCKRQTLQRWLGDTGLDVRGLVVCEIGFGGGWCLPLLQEEGATALGLEPIPENRAHAARLGIAPGQLFDAEPLPVLPAAVDLWLFQDSFEHVPDPVGLAHWIASWSARGARVLLVAPDAASRSRRWMGRFWVHHSADHHVHYTPAGVAAILAEGGFRLARRFRPTKCVALRTALDHLRVLAGLGPARPRSESPSAGSSPGSSAALWFNLGEMGLLFERDAD